VCHWAKEAVGPARDRPGDLDSAGRVLDVPDVSAGGVRAPGPGGPAPHAAQPVDGRGVPEQPGRVLDLGAANLRDPVAGPAFPFRPGQGAAQPRGAWRRVPGLRLAGSLAVGTGG